MNLILQIENYQTLDDGGLARIAVPASGLSAGRSSGMGWVLPDASRHISGHHFDVSHDDRGWWLRDVSTNGTFLQGQRYRLDGAHMLSHGDRFQVGQYIIVALIGPEHGVGAAADEFGPASLPDLSQAPGRAPGHGQPDDPWAVGGSGSMGYEPIDPLPQRMAQRAPDFADDFISTGPVRDLPPAPLPSAPAGPGGAAASGSPFGGPPRADHGASPFGAAPASPPAGFGAAPMTPAGLPSAMPELAPGGMPAPGIERRETTGVRRPGPPVAESDFVAAFCKGAGLPPDLYAGVEPGALAMALGESMRRTAQQVMLSLQDRAAAKQFARTGERTMRGATDNNPLKFLPDPDQAIEAMFLKPRAGFQTGADGLEDALSDLRLHQAALFAALQPALARLLGDLAPEGIEAVAETGRLGGNRKAKAWEVFVERWDAKTAPHENGMLDEFLHHFAAAYREMINRSGGSR